MNARSDPDQNQTIRNEAHADENDASPACRFGACKRAQSAIRLFQRTAVSVACPEEVETVQYIAQVHAEDGQQASYNLRNRTCPDAEEETQVLVKSTQSATSIQWNIFRSQLAKLPKLDADKPAAMSARARCQSKLTDPEDGLRNVPNKQLLELEEMLLESNQEKEMAKQASACFPPAVQGQGLAGQTRGMCGKRFVYGCTCGRVQLVLLCQAATSARIAKYWSCGWLCEPFDEADEGLLHQPAGATEPSMGGNVIVVRPTACLMSDLLQVALRLMTLWEAASDAEWCRGNVALSVVHAMTGAMMQLPHMKWLYMTFRCTAPRCLDTILHWKLPPTMSSAVVRPVAAGWCSRPSSASSNGSHSHPHDQYLAMRALVAA
ncbi:hypothetical protein VOLCADRAFT_100337 [Volvox carteri f. nagariensis]|uniref:Uncharacterized protein n=1 Tax=Volvox carteri f. nagariensis TaxID=3068 RepID=D8UK10_VOLCA|nr:uncharacterized protein VOLCADRAFT_100337 [Volvox carteri f. nagariensis]EFJ39945.1 hypothetical protein VOLCADRAFT_100337 [Volvox carteri f. nagariensis]|eukprot:XP_002958997.1 hypothetical protein VOLCADRAFT_100337 [Volvox carteri f. nagariensis]